MTTNNRQGQSSFNFLDESGDEADFFDDISGEIDSEPVLQIRGFADKNLTMGISSTSTLKLEPVTSFNTIVLPLKSITTALSKREKKLQKYVGKLDFIPEKSSPSILIKGLINLYNSNRFSDFNEIVNKIPCESIQTSVKVQIKLLSYRYSNEDVDLSQFVLMEFDSRVSSLLHWVYGNILEEKSNGKLALVHYLKCLQDYSSCTEMAPLSLFFDDFELDSILFKLANIIRDNFAKSTFFSSAITCLANVSSNPEHINGFLNNYDKEKGEDSYFNQDSDDSSDSLQQIKSIAERRSKIAASIHINDTYNNPDYYNFLDKLSITEKQVTQAEPPNTYSYKLLDGTDRMNIDCFSEWIKSYGKSSITKQVVHYDDDNKKIFGILEKNIHEGKSNLDENDMQTINEIYQRDPYKALPAMHLFKINHRGSDNFLSALLEKDYSFSDIISEKKWDLIEELLKFFKEHADELRGEIGDDLSPCVFQRSYPSPSEYADVKLIEKLNFFTDLNLIFEVRSPCTFLPIACEITIDQDGDKFLSRENRSQVLHFLYTTYVFPPYLIFRAAFALAVTTIDTDHRLCAKFLFEGLYILLNELPALAKTQWVYSAFFLLGEALFKDSRYFYSFLCLDNAIELTKNEGLLIARKASEYALSYKDIQRAVVYLTNSVLFFKDNIKESGSFYFRIAIILTETYEKNGQNLEGIQFLYTLLEKYFFKEETVLYDDFSGNMMLAATKLVRLLIKGNYFSLAEDFLNMIAIDDGVFKYLKLKVEFSRNTFNQKMIDFGPKSFEFDESFDILKFLKQLCRYYVVKHEPMLVIFWSEVIIGYGDPEKKEVGIGFYFRAIGFAMLFKQTKGNTEETIIYDERVEEFSNSFGYFKKDKKFGLKLLFLEALTSLDTAINYNEYFENEDRLAECKLFYVETIFYHLLVNRNFQRLKMSEISFFKPEFVTSAVPNPEENGQKDSSYIPFSAKGKSLTRHIWKYLRDVEIYARSIFDPLLINRVHVCLALLNAYRRKKDITERYFDIVLGNIRQFYFSGQSFIIPDISGLYIFKLSNMLTNMSLLLFKFEKDFINSRLDVFDLYIEIEKHLRYKIRSICLDESSNLKLVSDMGIGIYSTITKLENKATPDFSEFIKNRLKFEMELSKSWQIVYLLRRIKGNAKDTSYSEKECLTENRECCAEIIKIANEIRNENPSARSNELPHSSLKSTVFILSYPSLIVTYVPESGSTKFTKLYRGDVQSYKIDKLESTFDFRSNYFVPQFMKSLSHLVLPNDFSSSCKYSDSFKDNCVTLKNRLFGNDINFSSDLIKQDFTNDINGLKAKQYLHTNEHDLLLTNTTKNKPLVVVTSANLVFLPLEFMFPDFTIIRSIGIYKAYRRVNMESHVKTYTLAKSVFTYKNTQLERVRSLISDVMCTLSGSYFTQVDSLSENRLPFSIDKLGGLSDILYFSKYTFGDIIKVDNDYKSEIFELFNNQVIVFSYADLAEWSQFVDAIVEKVPSAIILFVPSSHFKQALRLIDSIFKINSLKEFYFNPRSSDPKFEQEYSENIASFKHLTGNSYQIASTIQSTLINELDAPVAMICPTSNVNIVF